MGSHFTVFDMEVKRFNTVSFCKVYSPCLLSCHEFPVYGVPCWGDWLWITVLYLKQGPMRLLLNLQGDDSILPVGNPPSAHTQGIIWMARAMNEFARCWVRGVSAVGPNASGSSMGQSSWYFLDIFGTYQKHFKTLTFHAHVWDFVCWGWRFNTIAVTNGLKTVLGLKNLGLQNGSCQRWCLSGLDAPEQTGGAQMPGIFAGHGVQQTSQGFSWTCRPALQSLWFRIFAFIGTELMLDFSTIIWYLFWRSLKLATSYWGILQTRKT